MGKRKNEPREIPIKFSEQGEGASSDNGALVDVETDQDDVTVEWVRDVEPAEPFDPVLPPRGDPTESTSSELGTSDLQSQIDALTEEKTQLFDQLLRRQAEFENFRKRTERERGEIYQRARAEVLLELLPVLDNFDRALSSLEQSGGDAEALHHGVELIHKQLSDALAKLGLQPLDSIGQAFDPHVHEAVTIEQTDEHAENTVIAEFERGYKIGDRLLRPAKVKVAASPER
ncbi:MAG TPA: nucleotide exchange factor GrpE [Blastocatellia bacterium]|nr:nucleotide exchange factor GrpE [Blastocatellia bacterium]